MDNRQLNIFRSAFKRANHGKIDMPHTIDIRKIYDIAFYPNGMRDGYQVRFFIAKDDAQNYYMELLGSDDYSGWHKRIDHTGNVVELDYYEGQFGRTVYPDDPQRTEREHKAIREHNDKLHRLLVQKGLERNDDDEAFETNHVIKIRNYGF